MKRKTVNLKRKRKGKTKDRGKNFQMKEGKQKYLTSKF